MDSIVVEGLRVVRSKRPVLRDLHFSVPAGTVTGLLGPGGCGKTTLMRCLVGVQKVAAGRVTVLGLPAGHPRLRHRVSYMTQAPSVYSDLTVAENLGYFRSVLGGPRSGIERVLEEVDLRGERNQVVSRLSGGQEARVSLAIALLGSPEVLVLDEPTVGLDPVLRRDLWQLFHRLADRGNTLLVSSHVMDEAARCDRLLLLRDGVLLADDEPTMLRRQTGLDDLDDVFLHLIESATVAEASR